MRIGIFYDHLLDAARQEQLEMSEIAARAALSGIRYADVNSGDLCAHPQELRAMLQGADMEIGAVIGRFDFAHGHGMEEARALVRLARNEKIAQLLVIPGFLAPGDERQQVMEEICRHLRPLVDEARQWNVSVTLEDYDSTDAPYATWEELVYLMRETPGLGCTFDTGNFLYSGEDALTALEQLLRYVQRVHCKDRALSGRAGDEGTETPAGSRLYSAPVGGGVIPVRAALEKLTANGYHGDLTIEHYGSPCMLADMTASAAYLRGLAQEK
ncbi:MAG: sugar phosphate isomerase/epimerase [Clostridia bacterium]